MQLCVTEGMVLGESRVRGIRTPGSTSRNVVKVVAGALARAREPPHNSHLVRIRQASPSATLHPRRDDPSNPPPTPAIRRREGALQGRDNHGNRRPAASRCLRKRGPANHSMPSKDHGRRDALLVSTVLRDLAIQFRPVRADAVPFPIHPRAAIASDAVTIRWSSRDADEGSTGRYRDVSIETAPVDMWQG